MDEQGWLIERGGLCLGLQCVWLTVASLTSWWMIFWGWLQIRRERRIGWGSVSFMCGLILWGIIFSRLLTLMLIFPALLHIQIGVD